MSSPADMQIAVPQSQPNPPEQVAAAGDYDIAQVREALAHARQNAPKPDCDAYALYLSGTVKLPPVPRVAMQLLPLLRRQDVPITDCTQLIEMDLALVGAMLRSANSVAYMRGQQVTNTHDAVMRIGLREAACLALSLSTRALFDDRIRSAMKFVTADSDAEWRRSVIVAQSARQIANRIGRGDPDLGYAAALFQGVGKVLSIFVLAQLSTEDPGVAALSLGERQAAVTRMRSVMMGEYLLREGLPADLCRISVELAAREGTRICDTTLVVRLTQGLVAALLGESNEQAIWLDKAFGAAGQLGIGRPGLNMIKQLITEARDAVDGMGSAPPKG